MRLCVVHEEGGADPTAKTRCAGNGDASLSIRLLNGVEVEEGLAN